MSLGFVLVAYLLAPRVNWVPLQHPGYAAYSQPYTQLSVIPLTDPLMRRTPNCEMPAIEFDYDEMRIRVDTRGLAQLAGTLRFTDLEQLPSVSHTFLLQCSAPNPQRHREVDRRPLR